MNNLSVTVSGPAGAGKSWLMLIIQSALFDAGMDAQIEGDLEMKMITRVERRERLQRGEQPLKGKTVILREIQLARRPLTANSKG